MKWEYKTDRGRPHQGLSEDYVLEKAGEEGWELVAVIREDDGNGNDLYFKRPKEGT